MTQNYIIGKKGKKVYCLDTKCIQDLHNLLSKNIHLLKDMDPVKPEGIKNIGMLESAVNRQYTGYGDYYKYDDCFSNVATLVYGVIKNHAFHNGNKRTGLLCIIKHLYNNGYVLNPKLKSIDLYNFILSIAKSSLEEIYAKDYKTYPFIRTKKEKKMKVWDSEISIRFMQVWLKKNSKPKKNTLKGNIKVSVLKSVLQKSNIELSQNGAILTCTLKRKIAGLSMGNKKIRTYNLGSNQNEVNKETLLKLRKDFNLTKKDGIDNTFFYDESAFMDSEIKAYKKIIYQLSKT